MNRLTTAVACLPLGLLAGTASGVTIEVEFVSQSFFSENVQAEAAIRAAADHVGAALTSGLAPIEQDTFTSTVGNTTATLDWSFAFRDQTTDEPIGNLPAAITEPRLAADTVRVFIDAQPLDGVVVGTGVPAGAAAEIGARIVGDGPLNPAAIQGVAALADAQMNRGGGGPLIGQLFEGPETIGGVDIDAIRFRPSFGGVTFDNDTDDNDAVDSSDDLLGFWHVDHTAAVDPGKIDLFSVAVSEIAAALGFGTSDSFEALASGVDWLGAEAAALRGDGAELLDPREPTNLRSGTLSRRAGDGAVQEAALDPDIAGGLREELTALDLAVLRDIGWETVAIEQTPGDYNGDGRVDVADYTVWRDNLGAPPETLLNDSDGGVIGVAQHATWVANFGAVGAGVAAVVVPEPSAAALAAACLTAGLVRRRRA